MVLVGNFRWKIGKNAISIQSRSSPPRRRELRLHEELLLGEPESPNLSVSATSRHGLLRLGVGPRLGKGPLRLGEGPLLLGEGPLRLGEPEVLFSLISFVNSRNHHLLVRITIELNNKHEIILIDDLNK